MLKPDSETLGLWRVDPEKVAGAHVLIIGISDYPFLSGGSAPRLDRAPDSGGLKQLEVSALSGALFFDWINKADAVAGAQVASCRLLLAPRRGEETAKVSAITRGHHAIPDYETIRSALIEWGDDLSRGGRTGSDPNVAIFFFSGHGVEVAASPAILARDVFNQNAAAGGANKALAVDDMSTAIKTYNVDRGLFFVDACRDSPVIARLLNLVGDSPLKPNPAPSRRVDSLIRLQSTASGLRSYQVATDPGTIFTQAVLDGLEGPPPSYIPYDTTDIPWRLLFGALEGHVKRKVQALLRGHSPLALQPVEPYGNPYNAAMLVAVKVAPDAGDLPPAAPPIETTAPQQNLAATIEASAANILRGARSFDLGFINNARGDSFTRGIRGLSDLANYSVMHEVFGHENITYSWLESLTLLQAHTGEEADPNAARIVSAHSQLLDDRLVAWVDLAVAPQPGGAIWIGAGRAESISSAVVIPQDLHYSIPVRLEITLDEKEHGWALSALSARLADPSNLVEPTADAWRILWEAQRIEAFADLASASHTVEQMLDLQAVVDGKSQSPLAAALALNYLLRSNGLDYLHDWPRNLATWFGWLADGPILWSETLLRQLRINLANPEFWRRAIGYPEETLEFFLMTAERGAPLLSGSLVIAHRQARFWRRLWEEGYISPSSAYRMEQALGAIERASTYLISGGSFSRFVSAGIALSPELVLGTRRRFRQEVAY